MDNLLHIQVLLHIYTEPIQHEGEACNAPWWRECVNQLIEFELIEVADPNLRPYRTYVTTERAAVYCEAIRNLPLPEKKWAMPVVVG